MVFSLIKGTPFRAKCCRCSKTYWTGDIPMGHPAIAAAMPMYRDSFQLNYCDPCVSAIRMLESAEDRASEL